MTRPNLLLITTDQQHPETLGCMGNPAISTPNVDALALEGVTFTNCFTTMALCTPARTSIFTGLFVRSHRVAHNVNMNFQPGPYALAPDLIAFPELLRGAGYDTSFFGKLHARHEGGKNFGLSTLVLAEGKGHFVPSPEAEDDYRRYLREKGYAPEAWQTWKLEQYQREGWVTSPVPEEDYIDTFIASRAIEYLSSVSEPFFCWVSFCTPHTPLDPPRPYDAMYEPETLPLPHRREGELENKPSRWVDQLARTIHALPPTSTDPSLPGGIREAYRRFPLDKTQRMRAAYYGEVSHADAQLGRLLAALKQRGIYENTLIIFTSDHGDYCGDHWAFYKYGGLYDSIIRVPLVIRWPAEPSSPPSGPPDPLPRQVARSGGIARPGGSEGRRVSELVSLADLAPTILQAAGVARPPMDGRPLQDLLAGAEDWRQELVVEGGPAQALVTPQWKYIAWRDGTEELYDRHADPHDLYNLGEDPALLHRHEALRTRLEAELQRTSRRQD